MLRSSKLRSLRFRSLKPRSLKALPLTLALVTLALAALTLVTTGCGGGSSQAQARFVNAIPNATALDIQFNGTKEFTDVAFFGYLPSAGYTGVPAGSDTILGFATGSTTNQAFSVTTDLTAGKQYTLVATGFVPNSVVVLPPTDNNTAPAVGNVIFRVINASPSGPSAVDIYILPNPVQGGLGSCTAPNCISGVAYQGVSTPTTLPYNSNGNGYTMYVTTSGGTNPIFSQSLSVGSATVGSIRTLVLTDIQNGNPPGMNPQAIILNDLN
jgi:hypothetical protein